MGALINEKRFYQDYLDVINESENFDDYDLQVYGRTWVMIVAVAWAFLLALVVLFESTCVSPTGNVTATCRATRSCSYVDSTVETHNSSTSFTC
jgi:hypothetical protein